METSIDRYTGTPDPLMKYYLYQFVKVNHKYKRYFVFELGQRGFFAEVSTVVRAAIYSHIHGLQLVLKNDEFGFLYKRGWNDYFEPFCKEYEESMESQVEQFCSGISTGKFMRQIIAHRPGKLIIDHITIRDFNHIMSFFTKLLYRPNQQLLIDLEQAAHAISLPDEYAAIHIRRGDKVGWEDVYYPVDIYLDHLQNKTPPNMPIFVMSDDYLAVTELQKALKQRDWNCKIYTLCKPSNAGFNVWDLRKKKDAYKHRKAKQTKDELSFKEHIYGNARQLITETFIASKSRFFVGTFRSNVSRAIRDLHSDFGLCLLLHKHDLAK